MDLTSLLLPWGEAPNVEVTGLSLDSRQVQPGDLFFALPGEKRDGSHYIQAAMAAGASAVLAEGDCFEVGLWEKKLPLIRFPQLKARCGEIGARFYGNPSQKLKVIAITGTNGKTSSTHYLATLLNTLGLPCSIVGTLGNGLLGELIPSSNTTPDPISLQRFFANSLAQGCSHVAMEASSHALVQHRLAGTQLAAAVFTNLSLDHLDYHHTFEAYTAAKKKLFTDFNAPLTILNGDDEQGKAWATEFQKMGKKVYVYGLEAPHTVSEKWVTAKNLSFSQTGISGICETQDGWGSFQISLLGHFNLSNVLGVVASLLALGVSLEDILPKIHQLQPVKGRMQFIQSMGRPTVVIDYAHTPDALEKALKSLRPYVSGKLWCVFGCGGDRDKSKRPLMGKIASECADQVILTNDNSRSEDPLVILEEIAAGMVDQKNVIIEPDRRTAIHTALKKAHEKDWILIAGKGHEEYQEIQGKRSHFSDWETVTEF